MIIAGRATDTAVIAAAALRAGCPPGPTWHAAKTAECGGQCTTNPRGGGVLVEIDDDGFTVEPLDLTSACTPMSVAAHMVYENANPNTDAGAVGHARRHRRRLRAARRATGPRDRDHASRPSRTR